MMMIAVDFDGNVFVTGNFGYGNSFMVKLTAALGPSLCDQFNHFYLSLKADIRLGRQHHLRDR